MCDICSVDLSSFDSSEEVEEHIRICFEEMMSEATLTEKRINLNSRWEQQFIK